MAEQFNYSSVLAPYMKHLLEVKLSQGISAHRTKWILKEIDDFASNEGLSDAHITEAFVKKSGGPPVSQTATGRSMQNTPCGPSLQGQCPAADVSVSYRGCPNSQSPTLHRISSLRNRCLVFLLPQTVSGSMTSAWELR